MPETSADRPRAVFLGSGPVAAESLELLLAWCDIEAVITKPQPPHHKEKFPVIAIAEEHNLPLHFVSNRRQLDELVAKAGFTSKAAVLIDFGIIVSRQTIDSFDLGIVNSHFSILPEWRGADPITFAILSGQPQTGVSLMMLVEAMDEGPIIAYGEYDLQPDDTTPGLTDYLIQLSDALLQRQLPRLLDGDAKAVSQNHTKRAVSYSRKLTKNDGILDFTKPAKQLEREIRAFAGWPKSRMVLAGKDVVVAKAHVIPGNVAGAKPGDVIAMRDVGAIIVETSDGQLSIERLKPAGKQEMDARAFLAGYRF